MDQQASKFLTAVAAAGGPTVSEMTPAAAREMFARQTAIFLPPREDVRVSDFVVPRESGDGVSCRLYRPEGSGDDTLPVVLYFHGGGWVMGSVETHDTLCQHLCHFSEVAIVSVDYRLAPEHPFPAAADDCLHALNYVHRNAELFKVDPKRIAVAGDSAGGNLAALVSRAVRDLRAPANDHPAIVFQALIYPVIDAGCATVSYSEFATDHGLSKEQMQYFWKCYCGGDASSEVAASPLREVNLSGLPTTWILTAEFDVLRDEAESYAFKLKTAGTRVDFERWRGQIHGFVHYAGFFDEGRRAVERVGQKLKVALK